MERRRQRLAAEANIANAASETTAVTAGVDEIIDVSSNDGETS